MKRAYPFLAGLVVLGLFAGCAKQQIQMFSGMTASESVAVSGKKNDVYQRGFRAAQALGFRPVGGQHKGIGIYNGARGDGLLEHSELSFVVEKTRLVVDVKSNKDAREIALDFIRLYNEGVSGRGFRKEQARGEK
ncbi:MAG: hypothetical protein V3W31_03240 [Thermodesulfobacteriota bacterium]